jgi:hypothetical protein
MRNRKTAVLAGLMAVALAGCVDLNVANPNQPDTQRALANPGDVESLIASSFRTWYDSGDEGVQGYYGPALVTSDMALMHSSSWGNAGMRELASQPRVAIDNNPAWSYNYAIEDGWYAPYSAIKGASDGLRAIAGGVVITDPSSGADNTKRAEAWAHFIEGISLGFMANLYDQAFIYDETVDLSSASLQLQPYPDVLQAALGHLDQCVQLSTSNSFTIPSSWINGLNMDNTDLAKVCHSFKARFMVDNARTPAERQAVDWTAVASEVDQGLGPTESWGPMGDGFGLWYDDLKWYGVSPGWARMHLQYLGMADASGAYQTWMSQSVEARQPFLIDTDDQRVTGGSPTSDGTIAEYEPSIGFIAARGTYFFSNYAAMSLYGDYVNTGNGPMPLINGRELQLYKAEGDIYQGNLQAAADIINQTRVADGGLPPVTTNGVPDSPRCVPRLPDGSCGSLMNALQWEVYMDTYQVGGGVWFFDERGWGQLIKGTPIQMPVPGRELQVLQMPLYTFGGSGDGAAPGGPFGNYVPGFVGGSGAPIVGPAGHPIKAVDLIASLSAFTPPQHAHHVGQTRQ